MILSVQTGVRTRGVVDWPFSVIGTVLDSFPHSWSFLPRAWCTAGSQQVLSKWGLKEEASSWADMDLSASSATLCIPWGNDFLLIWEIRKVMPTIIGPCKGQGNVPPPFMTPFPGAVRGGEAVSWRGGSQLEGLGKPQGLLYHSLGSSYKPPSSAGLVLPARSYSIASVLSFSSARPTGRGWIDPFSTCLWLDWLGSCLIDAIRRPTEANIQDDLPLALEDCRGGGFRESGETSRQLAEDWGGLWKG